MTSRAQLRSTLRLPGRSRWPLVAGALLTVAAAACTPQGRVPVYIKPASKEVPGDASVIVDERFVGPLGAFRKRALLLRVGEHRISVEKNGYFPFDQRIETDRAPVTVQVKLRPVPE